MSHDRIYRADVRIAGEQIAAVGPNLAALPGEDVYDISGCYLMPGCIDAHTHLGLRTRGTVTAESIYSGSISAAYGGVTTVIDYADVKKGVSLAAAIDVRKAEFLDSVVDYTFHLVLNEALTSQSIQELETLTSLGISSVKLFTTYGAAGYMFAEDLWQPVLTACANHNILVTVHAEDEDIVLRETDKQVLQGRTTAAAHPQMRPVEAEAAALKRLIAYSRSTGCSVYIVHLSSGEGYQLIKEAKADGVPIMAESAPHYLLLDETYLSREQSSFYVMTPPLRTQSSQELLWQGLGDGTISVIATDHCGFSAKQKTEDSRVLQMLPGIPGVETLLPLMYSYGVREGRFDLMRLVQVLATNPAKLFGLYPQKGSLLPGSDADMVVYDPRGSRVLSAASLHSQVGYTPFEGFNVFGQVVSTVIRGNMVVSDHRFVGTKGWGNYFPARRD